MTDDSGGADSSVGELIREIARAPSRPLDPERIAHFRIVGRIGKGGMGVVYRAEDEKLQRAIALKVLRSDAADDASHRKRFIREARSAAALAHPNIAVVHEIGEDDGIAYIAMELVDGVNLRTALEGGALPRPRALHIASQVARGLACAHAGGIVHRDLKPENVIVGPDDHVKIVDFGLAKTSVPSDGSFRTDEGRVLGTPAYMSPEQARGKVITASTDVFAFGVMFHEMLTGKRPFEGDSLVDLMLSVERGRKRGRLAADLDELIDHCLAKDSSERLPDASGIVDALAATSGLSASVPAPARTPRVAIATIGVVAVITLAFVGWSRMHRSSSPAPVAVVETQSISADVPITSSTSMFPVAVSPTPTEPRAEPTASARSRVEPPALREARPRASARSSASGLGRGDFDRQ